MNLFTASTMDHTLGFAFVIGIVAGQRSMLAPAVIAWAAKLGFLGLGQSAFNFVASPVWVLIISLFAISELIGDKLPFIPKRIALVPLVLRMLSGGFCGACLFAAHESITSGIIAGVIGAILGAFAGYSLRKFASGRLGADLPVALVEDLVALALAVYSVSG